MSAPGTNGAQTPGESSKTLALDLGTLTGSALLDAGTITGLGTLLLATEDELCLQRKEGRERTADIRFHRFLEFLQEHTANGVNRIVFEDVIFCGSQAQTQLWASLRAAVWVVGRQPGVTVHSVPVATLKRFATGDGKAKKPEMARALANLCPHEYTLDAQSGVLCRAGRPLDDNEVDAIWLAHYAAAVDDGRADFTSVYGRKAAAQAERRNKLKAAKAQKKLREQTRQLEARRKRREWMAAIKTAGRCCGVYRKLARFGRAECPKCGSSIPISPLPSPMSTAA
jgi:hypothetical protein